MGFLQRFFHNVFREEATAPRGGGLEHIDAVMDAHLECDRYGDFVLTDAVRPSFDLQVVPSQGYRHDVYEDEESQAQVPVLMVAASKEKLFELFLDLLDPLGDVVDVVLETSHHRGGKGHQDLYREQIDLPILKSILWDFEDLLLNDGCTGIAVLNPRAPREVQFDEHKLLIVYGENLKPFEKRLSGAKVPRRERMKFITEAEHIHSSLDEHVSQFEELKMRLGMDQCGEDRELLY